MIKLLIFSLKIESTLFCYFVVQIFEFDPCSDYYVYAYLNRPDVQEALHANVTRLTHDWEPCSAIIQTWQDSPLTIIPLLQEFMANGLSVWIFR
jgi:serine carboxypeptidase-like clade 2